MQRKYIALWHIGSATRGEILEMDEKQAEKLLEKGAVREIRWEEPESIPEEEPAEDAPESIPEDEPAEDAPESIPEDEPAEDAPESIPEDEPEEAMESIPEDAPAEEMPKKRGRKKVTA